MLNVGLWRDMAKKEWTDGPVTWKKNISKSLDAYLGQWINIISCWNYLKCLKVFQKLKDGWHVNMQHIHICLYQSRAPVQLSGAFVWNDTMGLPPPIQLGEISSNSSRFSLQPLLWETWPGVVQIWFRVGPFQGTSWSGRQKHGWFQAGCPGDIWWFGGIFSWPNEGMVWNRAGP